MSTNGKRRDRECVRQAMAMLRSCNGFVLILDAPGDPDKVAEALKKGESLPSNLKIFASPEFQPARKTLAILSKVTYGLYRTLGGEDPTPAQVGLPMAPGGNGGAHLGPRVYRHIRFATDGDYGQALHLLADIEEIPPGMLPDQVKPDVKCAFLCPVGTDQARTNFPLVESWATSQAEEVQKVTGWPLEEVREMIDSSLTQLRKAWEQEAPSSA